MIKPILFNTEMTKALLGGTKTATRRVVKPKFKGVPIEVYNGGKYGDIALQTVTNNGKPKSYRIKNPPYSRVGDILYVRETFALYDCKKDCPALKHKDFPICDGENTEFYIYATDACVQSPCGVWEMSYKWTPSIHMPKEAARIFLRIIGIRIERLQDMTLDDFLAEGIVLHPEAFNDPDNAYLQAKSEFSKLWNSTIKKSDLDKYGWDANPWVTVNKFERISKEEALNESV